MHGVYVKRVFHYRKRITVASYALNNLSRIGNLGGSGMYTLISTSWVLESRHSTGKIVLEGF